MKTPDNIRPDDWNEFGFPERLLLKAAIWIDDQQAQLDTQEAQAIARGTEYTPSPRDRFVSFVIKVVQNPQAG